jgi:hypothetical protein
MLSLIEEVLRLLLVVTDLTKMVISLTIKDVRNLTSLNLLQMVIFQSFSTIMEEDSISLMLLAQLTRIEMVILPQGLILKVNLLIMLEEESTVEVI